MRGTRHSEEQVIAILKQADSGVKTTELPAARHHRGDLLPLESQVRRHGRQRRRRRL
jgi:hypothetical protein